MVAPKRKQSGFIALLDALGAATLTGEEVERFIESRNVVLGLLDDKADKVILEKDRPRFTTFTFNDTVLISFKSNGEPGMEDVEIFFRLIRRFLTKSLENGILFRGSISIGDFYVNEKTNTVMGPAVTDAAAWYDKADWMGVMTTPHASLILEERQNTTSSQSRFFLKYNVPLKTEKMVRVFAVNWPKHLFIHPEMLGSGSHRKKVLTFLNRHKVPFGTEEKYFNTLAFFDYVVKEQKLQALKTTSRKRNH